jgi:hypothetical protein
MSLLVVREIGTRPVWCRECSHGFAGQRFAAIGRLGPFFYMPDKMQGAEWEKDVVAEADTLSHTLVTDDTALASPQRVP